LNLSAPKTGTNGTLVTIIGTNFGTKETGRLLFADIEATEILTWSDVLIDAKVPLNSGSGVITISTPTGTVKSLECFIVEGASENALCEADSATISGLSATTTENTAKITWTTNSTGSSQAKYGLTSAYGKESLEIDVDPRLTSHSVELINLKSCTTYHYQALSKTSDGKTLISAGKTFTTKGCVGSSNVLSQNSVLISPITGGTIDLTSTGETISVQAPVQFADEDTVVQIQKLEKSNVLAEISTPENTSAIGENIYQIEALAEDETEVTPFNSPVIITMSYDSNDLTNLDEDSLAIHRWDGATWSELSNCQINKEASTVTCETNQFSTFGLFGQAQAAASEESEEEEVMTIVTTTTTVIETEQESTPSSQIESSPPQQVQIPITGAEDYARQISLIGGLVLLVGLSLPTMIQMLLRTQKRVNLKQFEDDVRK
jgi:hypothetical protein